MRTALNTALTNGQTNFIDVVSGNHPLGAALTYSSGSATNSRFVTGG